MNANQTISFPRELSDELGELIAEKARVCGGGAFDIWEAICEQFGTPESEPCAKSQVEPAAQPQSEPVARCPDAIIEGVMTSVGISHAIYASTVSLKHGEQVKLYAEQPAPVAVVLPARPRADEEEYERMTDYEKGLLHGGIELWDKIDELKRLNPSL